LPSHINSTKTLPFSGLDKKAYARVAPHQEGAKRSRNKQDGPLFRGRYEAIVVDAEEYLLAVTRYIHHLMRSRREQRNEARARAMYLCRKVAGMKHEEIAMVFGVEGYLPVCSMIRKMQVELEKGGKIVQR